MMTSLHFVDENVYLNYIRILGVILFINARSVNVLAN
jgi:hypothetical protein